jgi:signal transduction histidine kinase
LNTINGLKGIVLLLEENRGTEEMMQQIQSLSVITERLCETISAQRDLMYAEKRELAVLTKRVSAREIIESVIESSVFQGHIQRGQVQKHLLSEDFELETDPVLLSRVLVNMVKNAMEAPNTKPEILIGSARPNEHALFYVHNHSYIGEPAARYIFQPMRSTKGKYRGLGTYSMRLIGENFLGGKVGFKTIPEEGTTFFIELPFHFNQSYRDSLYLK